MITVTVKHKSASEIMDIVRELRHMGYVQGTDFDFAYHQAQFDNFSYEAVTPKHATFTFYTEKYATLFAIKYSS